MSAYGFSEVFMSRSFMEGSRVRRRYGRYHEIGDQERTCENTSFTLPHHSVPRFVPCSVIQMSVLRRSRSPTNMYA